MGTTMLFVYILLICSCTLFLGWILGEASGMRKPRDLSPPSSPRPSRRKRYTRSGKVHEYVDVEYTPVKRGKVYDLAAYRKRKNTTKEEDISYILSWELVWSEKEGKYIKRHRTSQPSLDQN